MYSLKSMSVVKDKHIKIKSRIGLLFVLELYDE